MNLVDYPQPIYLPQGVTKEINVFYTDPNDRNNRINGYNMQDPVAVTDWAAYQYQTASGTNYSNDIDVTVVADYRSNYVHYYLLANSANCWLTTLKARGLGIYKYQPSETFVGITGSASSYGLQELQIDQKYQTSLNPGLREAEAILAIEREPRVKGNVVHFLANQSSKNMSAFLTLGMVTWFITKMTLLDTTTMLTYTV